MQLDKKKFAIAIALVALVLIVGVSWYGAKQGWKAFSFLKKGNQGTPVEAPGATGGTTSATRTEAPKDISVPEPGSAQKGNVAVPSVSVPAAPGVDSKLRVFSIVADAGQYNPSTIIVRLGDNVTINFKAQDGTYDIVFPDYGLSQTAKQGETKTIAFQAVTDGQFVFSCQNACPKGKMTGTLIVAPK